MKQTKRQDNPILYGALREAETVTAAIHGTPNNPPTAAAADAAYKQRARGVDPAIPFPAYRADK